MSKEPKKPKRPFIPKSPPGPWELSGLNDPMYVLRVGDRTYALYWTYFGWNANKYGWGLTTIGPYGYNLFFAGPPPFKEVKCEDVVVETSDEWEETWFNAARRNPPFRWATQHVLDELASEELSIQQKVREINALQREVSGASRHTIADVDDLGKVRFHSVWNEGYEE